MKQGNLSCARVVEGIAKAGIELERTHRSLKDKEEKEKKEEMQHA